MRMQIEESFRDTKSHRVGFNLDKSLTKNKQLLEILLLIDTLATFNTWLLGILTEMKK